MKYTINNISTFLEKKNVQKVFLYLVVLLFFCLVYILNILFPLQADDWGYSFILNGTNQNPERIHSVFEIFVSQYNHYLGWGGRSVVHFIAQFLLFIDIRVANLLNSLAYICLFIMVYAIINKGKKPNAGLFILLNIVIWLIQPAFSIIILWLTGSANYVWGALLQVLFIYPYYLFYLNKVSKDSILKGVLFFLWGILSGWTNENSSLAMIFLLISLMCYLKYQKVKLPKWVILGIIGACIGCAIMILAPGNMVRSSILSDNFGLSEVSSFKLFKMRIYNMYNAGALRIFFFSIIYVVFLFLYLKMGEVKNKIEILYASLAFFVSALIGFIVLYPVPYFPRDVWTGIHIFFFIAIGVLYVNTPFNNQLMKICRSAIFLVLIAAYINHTVKLYKEVDYFSVKSNERELFVAQEKTKGKEDMIISEQMFFPLGSLLSGPLSYDKENWTNILYARYYNLHSVILKWENE